MQSFVSPARSDIFQRLAAEGPLTAKQLGDALGLRATAVYHHLDQLTAARLVKVAVGKSGRGAKGRPGTVYRAVSRVVNLSKNIQRPGHAKLLANAARAAAGEAGRDFNAALANGSAIFEGDERNSAFFRNVFSPSLPDLLRVHALLAELREITAKPNRPGQSLLTIAWFMAPIENKSRSTQSRS